MPTAQIAELLKELPFFSDLGAEKVHTIASHFKFQIYKKGELLADVLQTNRRFYFIIGGTLKVYQVNDQSDREITLFVLCKNDVFDLITLLDSESHDVLTEVLVELQVLSIAMDEMRELMDENPYLLRSFMPHLSKRMRMLEQATVDLSLSNTLTRIAKMLLTNIDGQIQLTHEEMASYVGSTRAVVNRYLQEIRKMGIITIKRKQIIIENLEELKRLAVT